MGAQTGFIISDVPQVLLRYMRAYKRGHKGLEVEIFTKKYKTHRCALDTDYTFVTED